MDNKDKQPIVANLFMLLVIALVVLANYEVALALRGPVYNPWNHFGMVFFAAGSFGVVLAAYYVVLKFFRPKK